MSAETPYQLPDGYLGVRPGDRIVYKRGDDHLEATVSRVEYTAAKPAVYAELTRWQQAVRRLTPRRWRKPIPIVREATAPQILIVSDDAASPLRAAEARMAAFLKAAGEVQES